MDTFSEQVKEFRQQAGMSQAECADYLCTTQETISRWETGKKQPSKKMEKRVLGRIEAYHANVLEAIRRIVSETDAPLLLTALDGRSELEVAQSRLWSKYGHRSKAVTREYRIYFASPRKDDSNDIDCGAYSAFVH